MSQSEALYSDAQANEILRTAVRLAAPAEITFDEMVAAAKELGISREELKEAEEKYRISTTEAGQREEFSLMQKREVHAFAFHIGFIALIVAVIVVFDLPKYLIAFALPVLILAAIGAVYWRRAYLLSDSPKHEESFQNWQRRKKIWLRPERAREMVEEVFSTPLSLYEKLENGDPRHLMRKRIRKKFGYDRRRAKAIVDAYCLEHPDAEENFGG